MVTPATLHLPPLALWHAVGEVTAYSDYTGSELDRIENRRTLITWDIAIRSVRAGEGIVPWKDMKSTDSTAAAKCGAPFNAVEARSCGSVSHMGRQGAAHSKPEISR